MADPTTTEAEPEYDPVTVYRAETARLTVLTGFLRNYGLTAGVGTIDGGLQVIDDMTTIDDADVTSARNLCLIAAFRAVGRLADAS